MSDTTGMANPRQVYDTASFMRGKFPEVRWFLHFHNTRGMALAKMCIRDSPLSWCDGLPWFAR